MLTRPFRIVGQAAAHIILQRRGSVHQGVPSGNRSVVD